MSKGMLLIISGPSGSGKGTVVAQIKKDTNISVSISLTTRQPRPGEEHGIHYFFTSVEDFNQKVREDELLEHAQFVGNLYGTPRRYVEEQIEAGKTVILEIDVNGALQVKEKFPQAVLLFLLPPTHSELQRRLETRATENLETIHQRLRRTEDEIKLIDKYDYLVINDDIDQAACQIRGIVRSEMLRPVRSADKIDQFKDNM